MQKDKFYYSRMLLNETPIQSLGPGSYSPTSKILNNSRSAVFPKGDRFKQVKSSSPGPGAYNPSPPKVIACRFGQSDRDTKDVDRSPGPGSYELPKNPSPGKSIMGRNFTKDTKNPNPGPGSYDVPTSTLQSSPVFSMGKSVKLSMLKENQGPGFLALSSTLSKSGKTFPKGLRPEITKKEVTPGPAQFNVPSFIGEGPKFTIPERKTKFVVSEVPGPAYYSPKGQMKNYASTFARQARFHFKNSELPGPGQYEPGKFNTITYSFPKDVKEREDSDDEPGPGHYNLPSSIPDFAKFNVPKEKNVDVTNYY